MTLEQLLSFLTTYFAVDRYPQAERGGIFRSSNRPVYRLGVVLEPDADLGQWVAEQRLDALWLHRPWSLITDALPPGVGVFYHHLPFDETLTMGYNRPLAEALGMPTLEALGYKQANEQSPKRAIGMIGNTAPSRFEDWKVWVTQTFGGYDQAWPGQAGSDRTESGGQDTISRVAVVGAMNEALIRETADRGARLYLTGQYRKSAQEAVDETGMAVIAIGHRRSEEWGLVALANVLSGQFPGLVVVHKKSGQSKD